MRSKALEIKRNAQLDRIEAKLDTLLAQKAEAPEAPAKPKGKPKGKAADEPQADAADAPAQEADAAE